MKRLTSSSKTDLGSRFFFGLVDHQRPVVAVVQRQIEEQKNDAARARRQLADVDAVIVDAIADRDMIGAEKPLGEALRPGAKFRLIRVRDRGVVQQILLI